MSGLKKDLPSLAFSKNQITPDEIDRYEQYWVFSPSISSTYIGTANGTATTAQAFTISNLYPDYPRNLAYSVTGVAGGQGGTISLSGQDFFGGTVTETVSIATAAGGGTVIGTAIFAKVGGGTFTPVGLGGTAIGTAAIGFGTAVGSASGAWFGLPQKIGSTADVKTITWGSLNVTTTLGGGSAIGTLVHGAGGTVPQHAFQGTSTVMTSDRYLVTYQSSWDNSSQGADEAGL